MLRPLSIYVNDATIATEAFQAPGASGGSAQGSGIHRTEILAAVCIPGSGLLTRSDGRQEE